MKAGVVEGLELVFSGTNDQEREMRDVVDVIVADVGNVVLVASHLPDLLPDLLDLEVMEFPGEVTFDRNAGRAGWHGGLDAEDVPNGVAVLIEQLQI
jgi:hypothetical protein